MTATKKGDEKLLIKKSNNVIMIGLLDYNTYVNLLQIIDVIMNLTTDNRSIIARAYEVVSLEQQLITSDRIPLKR